MAPIVHGLEVEYFGVINFVYLDIDDKGNSEFSEQDTAWQRAHNSFHYEYSARISIQKAPGSRTKKIILKPA